VRNRVLFVCVLVSWLCGVGCQRPSKKPGVVGKPVEVPPSRILTLSEQQLISLDWHSPNRTRAHVKGKRVVVAGPGVEFDIYFPSNSPRSRSLNFVSSGQGGTGTLVGADIRGYEVFALKFTLVSINGQSEPELKQKLMAGAVIGPTGKRQLRTYEPVTLGLAASEKTVIAKTPVSTDKIYQIGFHVHMLNPQEWDPSGSMVILRVEPVENGKVDSAPATVSIKDAPNLIPVAEPHAVTTMEDTPVEISLMGSDPDSDPLTYSTIAGPSHGSLNGTEPNLTYMPSPNFYGSDSFTFKVNDGTADSALATVSITVKAVNDAPRFTSTPLTKATVDALYTYDVNAADPDAGDTLTYSLTIKPAGMTIDAATGLIEWTPASAQAGANDVAVKVIDNGSVPASQTQSFTITASLPSTPATTVLSTTDGCNPQKCKTILSAACKSGILQTSNNNWRETDSGLYTSYDFSDVSIPAGVEIASVVVYVEHFEQEGFTAGKLEWAAGTGWPSNPVVWASINAPVYEGEPNEATDLWDVTSLVDTPEKVNSLQLQVRNNDDVAKRKTLVDYIYAVVEWN